MARIQLGRHSRFLTVGDRGWPDEGFHVIKRELSLLPSNALIITSDAQGADSQADLAAAVLKLKSVRVKLEEEKYGRYADMVRNIRMFEQYKPEVVLAFISGHGDVKAVKHCMSLATKRGIPIRTFRSPKLSLSVT